MKFFGTNRSSLFIFLLGFTFARLLVFAQTVDSGISAKIAENSERLRQYTHLRKTEVYWKGELKKAQFAEVNFDVNSGKEISVPLGSTGSGQSQPVGGGFIMTAVMKKIANIVRQNSERLSDLMKEYLPVDMRKIESARPGGEADRPSSKDAQIVLRDYARPGDSMTISMDPHSKLPAQIRIASNLDGNPVAFNIDFASLADGTSYPSMVDMKWDAKKLELRVTNFDYHK